MLSIGAIFLWVSSNRPSILIINAYSTKTPWVKNINQGIRKIFKEHNFYLSYYHYMDIKESLDQSDTEEKTQKSLEIIESLKPDYLILVDDITQEKIGRKYINHEKIQIIYCGVKRDPKDYGYDKAKNVTGIHISLPLHILDDLLVFNIIEKNFSQGIRLTHLSDNTLNSQEDNQAIKAYKGWNKVALQASRQVTTFQEWKTQINTIKGPRDVIIISNYQNLMRSKDNTKFVSPKEVIQWTIENATVPLIGLYAPFVLLGGHFSIAPSALEQGEKAAKIVENLIENDVYIDQLTPQQSNGFLIYLRDLPGHKPYKLKVPAVYEAFARAMHHYYN